MKPATDISELPTGLLMGAASGVATPAAAPIEAIGLRVKARWGDFYELTKPRMNFLVVATTMVGYALATPNWSNWKLLLHTLLGTALTAAAASVLNQYTEREFDALMPRTRNRPLPGGRVVPTEALAWGVLLGICGLVELAFFVNGLTALLGAFTLASYVWLYTPLKRVTTLCTIVGAVPGAIPPMMGVAAVTGDLTPTAWALFGILFLWQMPHFLAIAILYRDDYAKGGFMMLPVIDERLVSTGRQIIVYSLALIPVTLMPSLYGIAGIYYFAAAFLMGMAFLGFGVICAVTRKRADARQLFFASIVYLPCLLGALMMDKM